MEYRLIEYARDALQKRRIPLQRVERVLSRPEWTEGDTFDIELEHCLAKIKEFGDRVLRVIVNTYAVPPRVVTAHSDRRRSIR
jgi:hypothetical protein